jgi:hypothetical protein
MLKQLPTLDIPCLNRYQVCAHVQKVITHFFQSPRDNIAELYDLHLFESAAERWEFIDSLLADKKHLFPIAQHVEGGVCSPNPTRRQLNAVNEWLASTSLPGGNNPAV